ncbi:MAG: hypothetical protein HC923_12220 [Myxococcales bacterium]|nr:hypothetical protein [Myxococcales bacterium]
MPRTPSVLPCALALAICACSLDLDREAGELDVQIMGVPADVSGVRVRINGEDVEPFVRVLAPDGPSLSTRIESVPATTVSVVAETIGSAVPLDATAQAMVRPNERTQVVLTLSEGAKDELVSAPIPLTTVIGGQDILNERASTSFSVEGSEWTSFLVAARRAGRRAPAFRGPERRPPHRADHQRLRRARRCLEGEPEPVRGGSRDRIHRHLRGDARGARVALSFPIAPASQVLGR